MSKIYGKICMKFLTMRMSGMFTLYKRKMGNESVVNVKHVDSFQVNKSKHI